MRPSTDRASRAAGAAGLPRPGPARSARRGRRAGPRMTASAATGSDSPGPRGGGRVEPLQPRGGRLQPRPGRSPSPGPTAGRAAAAAAPRPGYLATRSDTSTRLPVDLAIRTPSTRTVPDVHPGPGERPHPGDRLGHRGLVGVVREAQVGPADVQVDGGAQGGQRHRRALGVPARPALAPRARPGRLGRRGRPARRHIGRVVGQRVRAGTELGGQRRRRVRAQPGPLGHPGPAEPDRPVAPVAPRRARAAPRPA